MPFHVVYTRKAIRDLDHTTDWVAELGARTLQRWERRYRTAYASLESDPHRYPAAEDLAVPGVDLRLLIFGRKKPRYRVYFTVSNDTVTIHAIRHAARDALSEDDL